MSIWRYGAKNSASENFLAPRAAFAALDNALSGHVANARCSTAPQRRRHVHHGHTYLQPNTRACVYGRRFFACAAHFRPQREKNFDTPAKSIGKACIVHSKPWDKIESDCHVHLYPGVWVVVMENEIFKLELVNVCHLSLQFQTWEWPRSTLELGDRNGGMTLCPS